ncbi:MAG: hypothetical protein QW831_11380 [Candidatus Jordarchaeaceae archaeon]
MIAFEDEKWLELNPVIGSGWMPRGEQRRILTPGVNQRINAFTNPALALQGETLPHPQKEEEQRVLRSTYNNC